MTVQSYPATKRLTQLAQLAPFSLPLAAAGALASHILSTVDTHLGSTDGALQITAFKNSHAAAWTHLQANNVAAFEVDVSVAGGTYVAASLSHRQGIELEAFPTRPAWAAPVP